MEIADVNIEGGCFCGSVRYRASSAPLGSLICHCKTCRALSAAPLVPWVIFRKSKFQFVAGTPATFHSSAHVVRTFCASCGTQLTYASEKYADEIDVTTCTLDDPNAYPPTHHSWVSHDLDWIQLGDDLPKYPQSKEDGTQF